MYDKSVKKCMKMKSTKSRAVGSSGMENTLGEGYKEGYYIDNFYFLN